MVGASPNHVRPSYFVYRYLLSHGFQVYGVNPNAESIDGDPCYPSLAACAQEFGPPDVVDVFRRKEEVVAVARDAIGVGAKAIWFQYGVINEEAIRIADKAGLAVVYDRCMKVEHARFHGGLTMTGMNSGVITSKRRM
jgi:predicted CoA-binding protein